jgi:type I restriction enzyme, S subunit
VGVKEASAYYQRELRYKQTEVGSIPEDWKVFSLGEIGKFKNGMNKDSEAFGHGTPFVNLMDVFGVSSISASEHLGLVASSNTEQSAYDLRRGDVIFVRSSVKPSGVGLTAVVEVDLAQTVYSGFLIRFRDSGFIDIGYKRHCFYEERFRSALIGSSSVSANTNISQDSLKRLMVPLPPTKAEQEAIAEVLSDTDALIESLQQFIAKKRHIKQGAMQTLLTGRKRLPGFDGEWQVKPLGELLTIMHGKSQAAVTDPNGIYPILATGGQIGTANHFIYDKPSVLIGRKGTIDKPHFMNTPFWSVDTLFYSIVHDHNDAKFLFYRFLLIDWRRYNEASGVPSLNARTIEAIEINVPLHDEQTTIASVLSDMDTEITALESRLAKTREIKQGMMQQLLTGRIRLPLGATL